MLSQAAQLDYATPGQRSHVSERLASVMSPEQGSGSVRNDLASNIANGPLGFPLISQGLLSASQVVQLVAR